MIPPESNGIFDHPLVWRGRQRHACRDGLPTGFPRLDTALPSRGWPRGVLIEITVPVWGSGELPLLRPVITRLLGDRRRVVWVAPPYVPYPPAVTGSGDYLENMLVLEPGPRDILWSMEKLLGIDSCALVLGWPGRLSATGARRLQLAAQAGDTVAMVFRTREACWQATTAALRIHVRPGAPDTGVPGIRVDIRKARGSLGRTRVDLPL